MRLIKVIFFVLVIIIALFLCILGIILVKQTYLKNRNSLSQMFDLDVTQFDIGKIQRGNPAQHTFDLRNRTQQTIKILNIKASCNCTTVIADPTVIEPHQTSQIKMTIDTAQLLGNIHGNCVVTFVDSAIEPVKYQLIFSVYDPTVAFSVSKVFFDDVVVGRSSEREFKLLDDTNDDQSKWKITKIQTSSKKISARLNNEKNIVCVLNKDAPIGTLDETLSIQLHNQTKMIVVNIPVTGNVVEAIRTKPATVFLGNIQKKQLCQQYVNVIDNSIGASLKFDSHQNSDIQWIKQDPESRYLLQLTAPDIEGYFSGSIQLMTGIDSQPIVELHYAGIVMPK